MATAKKVPTAKKVTTGDEVIKFKYLDENMERTIKEGEKNHVHVLIDNRIFSQHTGKVQSGKIDFVIIEKRQFPKWAANRLSVGAHKCQVIYAPEGIEKDLIKYDKKVKTKK